MAEQLRFSRTEMRTAKVATRFIIGGLMRILLGVLAADLLYLYYMGAWYDPRVFLEMTEVAGLYLTCVVSVVWVVRYTMLFRRRFQRASQPSSVSSTLGNRWRSVHGRSPLTTDRS